MWLSSEVFRTVIASTPLVSIDLVVENSEGDVLLGQRRNRPAQGFWFVPGGRILKNESLDAAFHRLTLIELGQIFERSSARLLDVYEHFYKDSIFGSTKISPDTHYVVLAYQLTLPVTATLSPPDSQHSQYRWWSRADLENSAEVHNNTRAYLQALR